jgi:ankyrin repeat protein
MARTSLPVFPHLVLSAPLSCSRGDEELVDVLLPHITDINRIVDNRQPLLHAAVDANQAGIVRKLLAAGADVHLKGPSAAQTAVAYCGDAAILDLLMDAGANINVQDVFLRTPLMVSAQGVLLLWL